jgi:hypothetical protein
MKYQIAAWVIVGFLVAGWSMNTSKPVWLVIMVLGFAVCGWLGVFKTNMVVAMGRKNYEKSKFLRSSPLSGIVLKPWYPTYIRCVGIFIWLWALAIVYLMVFHSFR